MNFKSFLLLSLIVFGFFGRIHSFSREELSYMAELSYRYQRFDDSADYIKQLIKTGAELNQEERSLLSMTYKKLVVPKINFWNSVSVMERKEEGRNSYMSVIIKEFKKKAGGELFNLFNEILQLLHDYLLPISVQPEEKVFYMKMQGDYYKYFTIFDSGATNKALNAYKDAWDIASQHLLARKSIRLEMVLSYAEFYYGDLHDYKKAFELAKQSLDAPKAEIENIGENQWKMEVDYSLAEPVMEKISANLEFWKPELQGDFHDFD